MKQKNVLLIDDDKTCNFISQQTLQTLGIDRSHIHVAMNGKDAIDLFNGYFTGDVALPEFIFLDLDMPIMDGFEFIKLFEKLSFPQKDKIKIIVVTSSINPADEERIKSLGIKHYINKPITQEAISIAISEY